MLLVDGDCEIILIKFLNSVFFIKFSSIYMYFIIKKSNLKIIFYIKVEK